MILTIPNPLLREIAKPVINFASKELADFIARMFTIMQEKNGAGLAAPQIGVLQRIFVYGFEFNPRYPDAPPVPKTYVINPEILWASAETIDIEEGCLSVPNQRGLVTRPESVTFSTMDLSGKVYEKTVNGFEARIVQHEIDHLNGILLVDRATIMRDLNTPSTPTTQTI